MISGREYEYRTGIGTDIHRLVPDRRLVLGGIEIPFELGLLAHSDGDVVLHAVIDGLLGAAGLGDIGMMFPDNEPEWAGADSRELVLRVKQGLDRDRWEIVNVDVIIHAERPKLGQYKGQIKRCISGLLDMDFANVNIKAKTNEGLDAVGQGQAISSTVSVLLKRRLKRSL